MAPADAYVADFVKDAPRGKLVSVGPVMQPLTGSPQLAMA